MGSLLYFPHFKKGQRLPCMCSLCVLMKNIHKRSSPGLQDWIFVLGTSLAGFGKASPITVPLCVNSSLRCWYPDCFHPCGMKSEAFLRSGMYVHCRLTKKSQNLKPGMKECTSDNGPEGPQLKGFTELHLPRPLQLFSEHNGC